MVYLVSAAVCYTFFGIIMKLCQNRRLDVPVVIMTSYGLAALVCCIILFAVVGKDVVLYVITTLSEATFGWAALQGLLFLAGFLLNDRCVWRCGVTLNAIASRASLVIPLLLCWLLLGAQAPMWAGLAVVIVALLLLVLPNRQQQHDVQHSASDSIRRRKAALVLLAVFLCVGVSDFVTKLATDSAVRDGADTSSLIDPTYLCVQSVIFISAFVFNILYCLVTRRFHDYKSTRNDADTASLHTAADDVYDRGLLPYLGWGTLLAISNVGCTASLMLALSNLQPSLFYPVYNVLIVVLGMLSGVVAFREKLRPLQYLGIVLAAVAIVMMTA